MGGGSQTRNLIYIQDCIDALLKMEGKTSYPPLVLNVGNEKTTTIRELAETIVKASGKKIEIRYDRSKPVGPLSRVSSTAKARQILGWSSTSSLEDGIRKMFDRMKQRLIGDDKLTL